MSEAQTLYVVLLGLYLLECLQWVPASALLLYARSAGGWGIRCPTDLLGNAKRGLHLASPFVPDQEAYLAFWPTTSLSPLGLCAGTLQCLPGGTRPQLSNQAVAFDAIAQVSTQEGGLLINGTLSIPTGTPEEAHRLLDLIRRCQEACREDRPRILRDAVEQRYDLDAAKQRREALQRDTRRLRLVCRAYLWSVYAGLPVLTALLGFHRILLPAWAFLWLGSGTIAWLDWQRHRALRPDRALERVGMVAKCLLCPPTAPRVAESLARHRLEAFHPIALLDLLPTPRRTEYLGAVLRDMAHPMALPETQPPPPSHAIAAWYWKLEADVATDYFRRHGTFDVTAALAGPRPEPLMEAYCPRCLAQYRHPKGACADCAGVGLTPFPALKP